MFERPDAEREFYRAAQIAKYNKAKREDPKGVAAFEAKAASMRRRVKA